MAGGDGDAAGMGPNRIDDTFRRLASARRAGVLPYLTGGYPDLETTARLIQRFDRDGAAAVEIGFPFSDSIADGPVIQDSFHRVLGRGQRLGELLAMVERVRPTVSLPLIAMVSLSIVQRQGLETFVRRAKEAGFDGLITPDVPFEEAGQVFDAASAADLKNIMLVATTTPPERAGRILELCSGFVYQVAAAGTTGERPGLGNDLAAHVAALRPLTGLPICVGFGISTAEQVRLAGRLADGVIVGSAVVRRITRSTEAGLNGDRLVETIGDFVGELIAATGDAGA